MNHFSKNRYRTISKRIEYVCLSMPLFVSVVVAQSYQATHYVPITNYYNSIDTTRSTFVTDLQNIIYPHNRITYDNYDETNVANFASRDTTNGQRVVTCVYSGLNYVYTPPFKWYGTAGVNVDSGFSREHSWCQSWMPSVNASGFTSRPEYSDQHHLYPTNQKYANEPRNNHPHGIVATVTSSYLECKLGKDANGYTVFEPRNSHKGDVARAMLYMAVCYNGKDGYDWTFNHLNNVILPDSMKEGPEDLNTLLAWKSSGIRRMHGESTQRICRFAARESQSFYRSSLVGEFD